MCVLSEPKCGTEASPLALFPHNSAPVRSGRGYLSRGRGGRSYLRGGREGGGGWGLQIEQQIDDTKNVPQVRGHQLRLSADVNLQPKFFE